MKFKLSERWLQDKHIYSMMANERGGNEGGRMMTTRQRVVVRSNPVMFCDKNNTISMHMDTMWVWMSCSRDETMWKLLRGVHTPKNTMITKITQHTRRELGWNKKIISFTILYSHIQRTQPHKGTQRHSYDFARHPFQVSIRMAVVKTFRLVDLSRR